MLDTTIQRLDNAITEVANNSTTDEYICMLLGAAGEALGVLRTFGQLNLKELMYDMARMGGLAGQYPNDFDKKAAVNE